MDRKFAEPLDRGTVWAPGAQVVRVAVVASNTSVVMELDG